MQHLPQSIRERLAATQSGSVNHPDADLLTAFAEGSLSGRERQTILSHLSQCTHCRDIIALTAPSVEAVSPTKVTLQPARQRIFRWMAVAAAVVVVGSAVTLQRVSHNANRAAPAEVQKQAEVAAGQPSQTAPSPEKHETSIAEPAKTAAKESKASTAPAPSSRTPQEPSAKKDLDVVAAAHKPPAPGISGVRQSGPMASADTLQQQSRQQAAYPASAPMHGAVIGGNLAQQRMTADSQNSTGNMNYDSGANNQALSVQNSSNNQALNIPVRREPAANNAELANSRVAQGRPDRDAKNEIAGTSQSVEVTAATSSERASKAQMQAPAPPPMLKKMAVAPAADFVWTISPEGHLLRAVASAGPWKRVSVPENGQIRAVSATAPVVWIATTTGLIYQSADAGLTWRQVPLPVAGEATDVHFTDPLHGSLTIESAPAPSRSAILLDKTPRDAQVWTTADGGKTWERNK